VIGLEGVSQGDRCVDGISVAPTDSFGRDVAVFFEVVQDPHNRARRDPHHMRDIALAQFRFAADCDEYVSVIGEERPRRNGEFWIDQHEMPIVATESNQLINRTQRMCPSIG
jgi:hypothetical protein